MGRNWLRGKLGLILKGGAMLSKSWIQFSVVGWGCVPSLLFDLRLNYGGGNEDNGNFLQKIPCTHCCTQCPQTCSRLPPTHASARDSWTLTDKSGSVSYGVTAPFSWVLVCTKFCWCPPRVCFPVLCKFWLLSGGVNGDPFEEGLWHTKVCCTQSPCPCGRPLLTHTSAGDTHTQFFLSLRRVSGSCCTQSLFGPSGRLWRVWGLILNVISPLLPSCWGFSFALGCGVSFFGGIQHSLVNGCSAVSCNFGVLTGEKECMSFYSATYE